MSQNLCCPICMVLLDRPVELGCGSIICMGCCRRWIQHHQCSSLVCPCCYNNRFDSKHIRPPYKNGYVPHMCCAYGAVTAAHVQVALMCRTCASYCHTSYMCNMYATCVRNMCCLHTCMLQVCCTSVSCMYACYNVLHICRLHTCKLLVFLIYAACIHACYYSAA